MKLSALFYTSDRGGKRAKKNAPGRSVLIVANPFGYFLLSSSLFFITFNMNHTQLPTEITRNRIIPM